jgi:hypothetical protein
MLMNFRREQGLIALGLILLFAAACGRRPSGPGQPQREASPFPPGYLQPTIPPSLATLPYPGAAETIEESTSTPAP